MFLLGSQGFLNNPRDAGLIRGYRLYQQRMCGMCALRCELFCYNGSHRMCNAFPRCTVFLTLVLRNYLLGPSLSGSSPSWDLSCQDPTGCMKPSTRYRENITALIPLFWALHFSYWWLRLHCWLMSDQAGSVS